MMTISTQDQTMMGRMKSALLSFFPAFSTGSAQYQRRLGLVCAVATVVGMGGYIGHLYSNAIATFGMIAIMILGTAILRSLDGD